MQAWPGRGSDVSCLSGLLCFARSFRSSSFLCLPLHSHHPHPPGHAGEGVAEQREEGEGGKGKVSHRATATAPRRGHSLTVHCPPIPITTQSERQSQSGQGKGSREQWDLGTLGHGGGGTQDRQNRATGGGPAWTGPQKKILGANVGQRVRTYTSVQPNPIQSRPCLVPSLPHPHSLSNWNWFWNWHHT